MKVDDTPKKELDDLANALSEYVRLAIKGKIPRGRLLKAESGITKNYHDNVLMMSLYVKIAPPIPKQWKKKRRKKK